LPSVLRGKSGANGSGQLGAGDICCIDKTSSAELSEAINSMYRWYAKSAVYYAVLEDLYTDRD